MPTPTIQWVNGAVRIIDQRKLPLKFTFLNCKDIKSLHKAIKTLAVRGAPALGAAAGFLAVYRYLVTEKQIIEGTWRPSIASDVMVAILLGSIGILLVIYLIRTL